MANKRATYKVEFSFDRLRGLQTLEESRRTQKRKRREGEEQF